MMLVQLMLFPSNTFSIPPNQGNLIEVCVDAGILYFENCERFIANGQNLVVYVSA